VHQTTHEFRHEGSRNTPEGRLWTSVLVSAVASLERIKEFYEHGYEDRIESIRRGYWIGRRRRGKSTKLSSDEVKVRVCEVNKLIRQCPAERKHVEWFFFAEDSLFPWICNAMEYDVEMIRKEIRNQLKRIKELEDSTRSLNIRSIVVRRPAEETALTWPKVPELTTRRPRARSRLSEGPEPRLLELLPR
jgi:hypothetical protein